MDPLAHAMDKLIYLPADYLVMQITNLSKEQGRFQTYNIMFSLDLLNVKYIITDK